MSQVTDYVVANATALAVRTDINNVLGAVKTLNSGTGAPSNPAAYMLWYDETNDLLKMRNGANNAWITIGKLDQTNDLFIPEFNGLSFSQGDLLYHDGTDFARLAKGTAAQVLQMNTGETAPEWVTSTPAGFEFITTTNLSSDATADFTGFDSSKYDAYMFSLQGVKPVSDNVRLEVRTSTNGGASYDATVGHYQRSLTTTSSTASGGSAPSTINTTSSDSIIISTQGGNAGGQDGINGTVWVHGPHLAKKTTVLAQTSSLNGVGNFEHAVGGGLRNSSADVDALRFLFASGSLGSGTITMYGLRNA